MSQPRRSRAKQNGAGENQENVDESGDCNPASQRAQTALIEQFKKLADETAALDITSENVASTSRRLTRLVVDGEKLADTAYTKAESAVTYDAEFVASAGHTISKLTHVMELFSRSFDPVVFATELKKFLRGDSSPSSQLKRVTHTMWEALALNHSDLIPIAPDIESIPGAEAFMSTQEPEPEPGPSEAKRKKRTMIDYKVTEEQKKPSNDKKQAISECETTMIEINKMKQKMNELFKKNGHKPVPYLTLVLDTTSFQLTVQNVFHFTFLVNRRWVRLMPGKDYAGKDLLMVNPLKSSDPADDGGDGDGEDADDGQTVAGIQAISSFNRKKYDDWSQSLKKDARRYRTGVS